MIWTVQECAGLFESEQLVHLNEHRVLIEAISDRYVQDDYRECMLCDDYPFQYVKSQMISKTLRWFQCWPKLGIKLWETLSSNCLYRYNLYSHEIITFYFIEPDVSGLLKKN